MIITIDGPAGSGKSSVAKELANRLGIYYLNTGLLYRAVAFIWLQKDPGLKNLNQIKEKYLDFIKKIEYKYLDKSPQIFYDDTGEYENITTNLFLSIPNLFRAVSFDISFSKISFLYP